MHLSLTTHGGDTTTAALIHQQFLVTLQEACGEAAVTAAWPDAAADLARLMPEGCGEGAVAQLLQQHNAEYLLT
jgi:hypothetical protein